MLVLLTVPLDLTTLSTLAFILEERDLEVPVIYCSQPFAQQLEAYFTHCFGLNCTRC